MNEKKPHIENVAPEKEEAGSFRLIMTLTLAGLFSGILLSTTYVVTEPVIKANKEAALREAIYVVLPGCVEIQWVWEENGVLVEGDQPPEKAESWIYKGVDQNGNLVGYALPGEGAGFQDQIVLIVGYKPENDKVIGFQVLDSRETPGLGDKIFKDKAFITNFKDLNTNPSVEFVKKGAKTKGNEVEGITGATISSKAVVKIVQESLNLWKPLLLKQAKENE